METADLTTISAQRLGHEEFFYGISIKEGNIWPGNQTIKSCDFLDFSMQILLNFLSFASVIWGRWD